MKMRYSWWLLGAIFLISIAVRFVHLDKIPNAIHGDELIYPLTAKSVIVTGKDMSGTWTPWSALIFRYPPQQHQAELSYFLHLPFAALFPFSLLFSRIPFALLSVGVVALLFLLVRRLIGLPEAIATAAVTAINPWLIYIGRTSYESTPAAFFYLLGINLLLSTNILAIYASIPVFLLAFYSYIGMKLIFLPLVILFSIWGYIENKKHGKPYTIVISSAVIIVLFFVFQSLSSPQSSRLNELLLPNSELLSTEVDHIRKTTMDYPFAELFINKATVYIRILMTRFFSIFSPTYLFMDGDEFYSLWRHGFFYIIDGFFLIIGALAVYSKKRSTFILLTLSIILSTFVHVFNTTPGNFCYHIAFMFLFLLMLIGSGIWQSILYFSKKTRVFVALAIACMYAYALGNFFTIYFLQHSLGGHFDFPLRIISRYATLANSKGLHVYISSNAYGDILNKYLFYTNTLTLDTIQTLQNTDKSRQFTLGSVTFMPCGLYDPKTYAQGIFIRSSNCNLDNATARVSISKLSDAGEQFQIYNDSVCNETPLHRYPVGIRIEDFSIESMPAEQFCRTFINQF